MIPVHAGGHRQHEQHEEHVHGPPNLAADSGFLFVIAMFLKFTSYSFTLIGFLFLLQDNMSHWNYFNLSLRSVCIYGMDEQANLFVLAGVTKYFS